MKREIKVQNLIPIIELYQDDGDLRAANAHTIADFALRRWQSFGRRSRMRQLTFEHRVEDLATGLRDRFDREPTRVGPERYRRVAAGLASSLRILDAY
jgi:hypothetical protein